jgi:universal stress protein E
MYPYKNLLAALDSYSERQPALETALALARDGKASIKLVDVVRDLGWAARLLVRDVEHVHDLLRQERQQFLQQQAERVRAAGIPVTTAVLEGRYSDEIIREALRGGHDLVIKVAKGRLSRRAGFFGTTALRLLRQCPTPVWIAKPESTGRVERIVAAVDARPDEESDPEHIDLNHQILAWARAACTAEACDVHVAYAWSIYGESVLRSHMSEEDFQQMEAESLARHRGGLSKLLSGYGLKIDSPNVHLLRGEAAAVIPQLVRELNADLIVLGTVARSGVTGWLLGNTAESILEQVTCSVLALKPKGFQSPIQV